MSGELNGTSKERTSHASSDNHNSLLIFTCHVHLKSSNSSRLFLYLNQIIIMQCAIEDAINKRWKKVLDDKDFQFPSRESKLVLFWMLKVLILTLLRILVTRNIGALCI